MNKSIIYLSTDIEHIKNHFTNSKISTVSGDDYQILEDLSNVDLAIISTDKKNLDLAIKFSKYFHIDVLLIRTENPQQISQKDIERINPIHLLQLPKNSLDFESNILKEIKIIQDTKLESLDVHIWFKGILNTIKDGVIAIDPLGNILFMNPVAQHIVGIEEVKAVGLQGSRVLQFKGPSGDSFSLFGQFDINDGESKTFEGELCNRITKGCIHVSGNITKMMDNSGAYRGRIITFKDVGEIKDLFSRINYQSSHDNLTGILNRKSFINYADQLITLSKYDDSQHGLLIISLDKFKVINDTCGHKAGDELLRKMAYMIKDVDKKDNFVIGRIGGDEFAVLFKNCSLDEIKHFTKSIKIRISKQDFIWGEKEFQIMSSYGIVTITNNTLDHYNLLASADDAIAIAKEKGGGTIEIYDNIGVEYNQRRGDMLWIHKLKDAIKNEKFKLFYQEIRSVNSSAFKKIEILVRLENENGDIISPINFIPSAEHYGIMPEIDKIVIEKSIEACKGIIDNGNISDKYMFSVNISGTSIPDKSLPSFILTMFKKYKVPPTLFCFEITETAAITNMKLAETFINSLKRIGCRFSLDDFGSGFSNFAYLRNLDVDFLKIDGSFIVDMLDNPMNRKMVESINSIGHIMKMKTIAEFVENENLKQALIEIGVDYLQGYIINKPTPIQNLLI